jgi:hypothetical protein
LRLIQTNPENPASPPNDIFGPEPGHGWCYFFEKAELARQTGDWLKVAEMADQAMENSPDMTEANALEWIPFIEGFARTGRWEEAETWSEKVYQVHPKMRRMLCALWARVQSETNPSPVKDQTLQRQNKFLNCSVIDEN